MDSPRGFRADKLCDVRPIGLTMVRDDGAVPLVRPVVNAIDALSTFFRCADQVCFCGREYSDYSADLEAVGRSCKPLDNLCYQALDLRYDSCSHNSDERPLDRIADHSSPVDVFDLVHEFLVDNLAEEA